MMKRYVSYSQIKTALRCPWKWGLKYLEGWRMREEDYPSALKIGSAMHELLASAYRQQPPIMWGAPTTPLSPEEEKEIDRLIGVCTPSVEEDLADKEVLATEWPLQAPVLGKSGRATSFVLIGWVDLIVRGFSGLEVWDHKTSKRMTKDLWSDFQLPLYATALRQQGANVSRVGLNIIKRTKVPEIERVSELVSQYEQRAWQRNLYAMCKCIPSENSNREDLAKVITKDCNWDCDFKEICKADCRGVSGVELDRMLDEQFDCSEFVTASFPIDTYKSAIPEEWLA